MGIFSVQHEADLSTKERNALKTSQFGLPEERKYPLNDADHVRSAIKLFGHCDESKRSELAKRINSAAKKFNVEIKKDSLVAEYLNESVLLESVMRKYKCPYCGITKDRDKLISHVEDKHDDLIPKGYSPTRVVFDVVNGKKIGEGHGTCRVCKGATTWNEKTSKYNVLCNNPACRKALSDKAKKNMIKVYGKPMLLDDPEHQQKMLANRSISGTYTFKDGGKFTYTGSYEKKTLEFFDQVLDIPSEDLMVPGPTLEYEFNGEKLHWITDIYYIPYNLIIEVKDGGDNPNTREMPIYRGKQYAKEDMITNLGKFNYLRLTNNDFSQLLYIMADMKANMLDVTADHTKTNIRINETSGTAAIMGAIPNASDAIYIVGYMKKNQFTGETEPKAALSNDIVSDKVVAIDEKDGKLKRKKYDTELKEGVTCIYRCNLENKLEILRKVKSNLGKVIDRKGSDIATFYEMLTGKACMSDDQIALDESFTEVDLEKIKRDVVNECEMIKSHSPSTQALDIDVCSEEARSVKKDIEARTDGEYSLKENMNGYFIYNTYTESRVAFSKDLGFIRDYVETNIRFN